MTVTWQNIKEIRNNGDYIKARELAYSSLQNNPNSLQIKAQLEWTYYDEIKQIAQQIKNSHDNYNYSHKLINVFEDYIKGNPRRPEMSFSMIIKIIAEFPHLMPDFYHYIAWMGQNSLRDEDWHYSQFNGRTFNPIAYDIARGLCKWIKYQSQVTPEQYTFCLDWVNRIRNNMQNGDMIWLDWDLVAVYKKIGDNITASQILSSILKQKQNEFWVWREAARLYQQEQKDLALACFCKAMLCTSADPSFLVSTHEEFALFLAELGMYEEASYQINQATEIRNNKGWNYKENLQFLLSQSWLNKNNYDHQAAQEFYQENFQESLTLCFDKIENVLANYAGIVKIHKDNRKERAFYKFIIRSNEHSISILASGLNNINYTIGESVELTIGKNFENDRVIIIDTKHNPKGKFWDCLTKQIAIISSQKQQNKEVYVFIDRDNEVKLNSDLIDKLSPSIQIGDFYTIFTAINPKNDRLEIYDLVTTSETKNLSDTKKIKGALNKNSKGFGFLEDVFIPPYLLENKNDGDIVEVLAIYHYHKAKNQYSWKAILVI